MFDPLTSARWNQHGQVDMRAQGEPRFAGVSLTHVQEFCACFASAAISHELRFRHVGGWQAIRAIVDAAENSGLDLCAVAFHKARADSLDIRLEGGSASGVAALWRGIQAIPGIVLADWQLEAQPPATR